MSFYKHYFRYLTEAVSDPFVLGSVGRKSYNLGQIETIIATDDDARHPQAMAESGITWRYVPELQRLTFWEPPTDEEVEKVKEWLKKNNYILKRVAVSTDPSYRYGNRKTYKMTQTPPSELQRRRDLGLTSDGVIVKENKPNEWSAVVLDKESQNKLKNLFSSFVPEGWTIRAHHMTIDPFNKVDEAKVNTPVNLMVTSFGMNENACAVKVVGYKDKTNNSFPHITIAYNKPNGAEAKDSNSIKNWKPILHHILLSGTIQNLKG